MAASMIGRVCQAGPKNSSFITSVRLSQQLLMIRTISSKERSAPSPVGNELANTKTPSSAVSPRGRQISQAMRTYLDRAKAHNQFMADETAEYEIGKRHLAVIMGEDPDTFSQDDIDRAIQYLLPSGLFDKKARPLMKHPSVIVPSRKTAQFDDDGRPFHTMFYTGKSNYVQLMHEYGVKLEELQRHEDAQLKIGLKASADSKIQLAGYVWLPKHELEKQINEKLSEGEYTRFLKLLERLSNQAYSIREKDNVMKYRKSLAPQSLMNEIPIMQYDENGRGFIDAKGKRKKTEASVRIWEKGSGKITVNNREYLDHFPRAIDRQEIMFPLQFCDMLRSVDVEAKVETGGPTGQAGAIRHAIAVTLQGFVTEDKAEKMRLAGLLTRDLRTRERKKPGQEGARRKFTWKKR